MDCPRCRLLLADAEYEGQHVQFCGTCWGYWLSRIQLHEIVGATTYRFGAEETRTVANALRDQGDANRQGAERDKVPCPVCGNEMKQGNFRRDCPVRVDECEQHGLWLDTGEIKDLQVYVEQSLR
jgi:Zn-finger nucleic acid-binding protein